MKLKSIYLLFPLTLSLVSCIGKMDRLKDIFKEGVTYTTDDDMLTFKFHNNLELGSGFAKLGDDYEPISFRLSKDDNKYFFIVYFENVGYDIILNFTTGPTRLKFVSGLDIARLDPDWIEWSSSYAIRTIINIDYDAKHYYGSTFLNPYYNLEMRYGFESFEKHDMKGVGKYEGLAFSFLSNDEFRISYQGNDSFGSYETSKKTMYLTFIANSLFENMPGIRIPMYVE